jgi:cysteine-rich repeat protein
VSRTEVATLALIGLCLSCSRTELIIQKRCGNALLEANEECDDGNQIDHDACSNTCRERACGNAIVEPGEACDLGADNEDRPAIELLHEGLVRARRPVMPVDRARDVVDFYDYTSESSHTGFEGRDLSALFLYRDTRTEILSLVNHHGIDEDSSGITIAHGLVELDMLGVPDVATIPLADEDSEMLFLGAGEVRGRFEFWRNTDGGAISALPFPGNWQIDVVVSFQIGISRWSYFLADDSEVPLDDNLVASLRAYLTPSRCRTDCTIPRCGDDFVDGGEVCDDGNTVGGDGCASDCLALQP